MRRILLGLPLLVAIVACGANAPATSAPASPAITAAPSVASVAVTTPPSAAPTQAPTKAPIGSSTQAPTTAPTPAPVTTCLASQLSGAVASWEGAAGHQIASVTLTKDGSSPCVLQGTPQLQLVNARGRILIDSTEAGDGGLPHVDPGDPTFQLASGDVIATMVSVSNYCGNVAPSLPTTIAFVLPSDGGRIALDPGPGGDVPACMASPGDAGLIEMNGWTR
jgi:hypothetical protein